MVFSVSSKRSTYYHFAEDDSRNSFCQQHLARDNLDDFKDRKEDFFYWSIHRCGQNHDISQSSNNNAQKDNNQGDL
jgi:hypothetical protein